MVCHVVAFSFMSQQIAGATRSHPELILSIYTLLHHASRPTLHSSQDCWLATYQDQRIRCLTAQKLDCVTSTMCGLLLYAGRQQHVLVILPVHFKVQVERK